MFLISKFGYKIENHLYLKLIHFGFQFFKTNRYSHFSSMTSIFFGLLNGVFDWHMRCQTV